jgi:MFS family permease
MNSDVDLAGANGSVINDAVRPSQAEVPAEGRSVRGMVLTTACTGVFLSFASLVVYTFGVFLKPLATTFHWTRAQVSFAFTLAALTVAVCSPFLGRLLDRVPARRVIIPCTLVYGVAFASLSLLTGRLWHLYAVFVVLGVVGNGTTQLGYARVVSAWFDQQRGRALAAVMAGSGLGSMLFPPIAEWLIGAYGWRFAYAVLGAVILAIALPLPLLFLREPRHELPTNINGANREREGAGGVWSRPFLGIAGALLLFSFATNGLNTHWAALLSDEGASAAEAGLVLSMAGSATLAAKLSTGYLLDRFRATRVSAMLLALSAAGFAIVLLPYRPSLALLSAILFGIGMGAESDAVPYLLTRYFGLSRFGELYGYTWCVYAVAGATGPVVMGAAFDRTGSYRFILLVSLLLVIAASALFASLPRYAIAQTGCESRAPVPR